MVLLCQHKHCIFTQDEPHKWGIKQRWTDVSFQFSYNIQPIFYRFIFRQLPQKISTAHITQFFTITRGLPKYLHAESEMPQGNYVLGVDIGTTSVKVCVIDIDNNNEIISKQSKDTQSNVPSDQGTDGNKQNVPKIISALNTCVAKLPKDLLRQIKKIGICGQMHGVMLWNNEDQQAWERIEKNGVLIRYDVIQGKVSALYTWQDSRCEPSFIKSLPASESHLPTHSGYGIATLFWMVKHKPEKLKKFNRSGTIQDFAVAILCNLQEPVTSIQNAASWGHFDCANNSWNKDILETAGFPVSLLPKVCKSGDMAGVLSDNWHTIPKGTPVGVALGDLQCSVLATLETPQDAVLNISTSAQLAFVAEDYRTKTGVADNYPIEYFPYFGDKYLAVAASLNGGNALATFVKMIQEWSLELGSMVNQSKIWESVINLSMKDNADSDLRIQPLLLGERHRPEMSAIVSNINIGNLGLGQVFRALCRGIIENMHSMMPREVLISNKITRIVGNGSGLSRNKVLQSEVQRLYQLPLVFTAGGDAAKGAAMAVNGAHF